MQSCRISLSCDRSNVDRAVQAVETALERYGPPVYVRRQIVHNTYVVGELERRGAIFVTELPH